MPNINIVMKVDIGGNPSIEAVQRAIEVAVNANEILNCKINLLDNGDAIYERVEKPVYSVEVSTESWMDVTKKYESRIFHLSIGELVRFFILTGENSLQLLIIAHHLVGDGLSIVYLIEDIMLALEGAKLTFKPLHLITTKDFPIESHLNPLMRFGINYYNKKWRKVGKVFLYPDYEEMFQKYWREKKTTIFCEQLSQEELERISRNAHKFGVSINSLITTAFARAYGKRADIGMAVSIRDKGYHGMGNYASGVSILYAYNEDKSFMLNAQAVHRLIYKKLVDDKRKYFVLHFTDTLEATLLDSACMVAYGGYKNKVAEYFTRMMGYDGHPKDISITNLTKLDIKQTYGIYNIKNISFAAPLIPNASRVIGIASLGGCVSFTMHVLEDENLNYEKEYFWTAIQELKNLVSPL
jgi:NRPS condensation-like uncharacterized protein